MRAVSGPSTVDGRDAVNELYDCGCDLVESAGAMLRAADDPRTGRAVPGTLGCVEAALRDLESVTAGLERAAAAASVGQRSRGARARARDRQERMQRGLANLKAALADAADAASAARSLTARALEDS